MPFFTVSKNLLLDRSSLFFFLYVPYTRKALIFEEFYKTSFSLSHLEKLTSDRWYNVNLFCVVTFFFFCNCYKLVTQQ